MQEKLYKFTGYPQYPDSCKKIMLIVEQKKEEEKEREKLLICLCKKVKIYV